MWLVSDHHRFVEEGCSLANTSVHHPSKVLLLIFYDMRSPSKGATGLPIPPRQGKCTRAGN